MPPKTDKEDVPNEVDRPNAEGGLFASCATASTRPYACTTKAQTVKNSKTLEENPRVGLANTYRDMTAARVEKYRNSEIPNVQ